MSSILERLREAVGMQKPKKGMNTRQKAARKIPGSTINKIADRNRKIEDTARELFGEKSK